MTAKQQLIKLGYDAKKQLNQAKLPRKKTRKNLLPDDIRDDILEAADIEFYRILEPIQK